MIVAGGRNFTQYELMTTKLDFLLSKKPDIEIVSGGAKGADSLGICYAKERNLKMKIYKADWGSMEIQLVL